jgi:hypothetical protein
MLWAGKKVIIFVPNVRILDMSDGKQLGTQNIVMQQLTDTRMLFITIIKPRIDQNVV